MQGDICRLQKREREFHGPKDPEPGVGTEKAVLQVWGGCDSLVLCGLLKLGRDTTWQRPEPRPKKAQGKRRIGNRAGEAGWADKSKGSRKSHPLGTREVDFQVPLDADTHVKFPDVKGAAFTCSRHTPSRVSPWDGSQTPIQWKCYVNTFSTGITWRTMIPFVPLLIFPSATDWICKFKSLQIP